MVLSKILITRYRCGKLPEGGKYVDIQRLRCFLSVAEHLNFTQAARHLFLEQPSLSRQVSELEKELGVNLFIRNNKVVKLTHAGLILTKYARNLILDADEAVNITRQAGLGIFGNLNIGFLGVEKDFLPQVVSQFRQKFPQTRITLNRFSWFELNESLDHEKLDVVFTYLQGLEDLSGIAWKKIYTDPLVAVLSATHPLANQQKISIKSLAHESFILTSHATSPYAFESSINLCIKNGFYPTIVQQPVLVETVLLAVEAGLGISILTSRAGTYASPNLRFIELDDNTAAVDLVIAWKNTNSNPTVPLFISELQHCIDSISSVVAT